MKPATKKTIIIFAVLAVIALIVWLIFFRKTEWEKIIDKLDVDQSVKRGLSAQVKAILADPNTSQSALEAQAKNAGMTYNQWLVAMAAMGLGYTASSTNGVLSITMTQY